MANVRVRRANVILDVTEDEVAKYLSNGFDVVDQAGNVVQKSTHGRGEAELRKDLEELQAKYDKLKAENEDLKSKLDALVAGQEDEIAVTEPEVASASKEKRTSKSKAKSKN